ncbi:epimerase [Coraliomargarita sinensis]|uniref:Epimerase n=1 Tax=Coraliomargarita sinensis TaxID=2174842 RepID=A0A317ZMP2_9BACT|nr:NAD-dependent epimerase/dehydratase family protein [Coraliomargarita sinensis]PXA04671.1 epimerase [Coraliomargarita sinensis]
MTSKDTEKSDFPESVMIFGCGYVGTALAAVLIQRGVRVGALTRNPERADELRALGVSEVIVADLDSQDWKNQLRESYAAVVNCVSSAGGGLDGYHKSYVEGQRRILEWAKTQKIRSYLYTSSTSVYAQDGGVVVDEDTETSGAPATGQVLIESEHLIETHAELFGAWYVFRLAGIYGPARHFLLNQLKERRGTIPGRGDYHMNMIHRDDIVSAVLVALAVRAPSGVYNIADDEAAPKETVLTFLADRLGLPVPEFDPNDIPPRLKRRGGRMPDRIVSNRKARAQLGWEPKYRSYREGYAALLKS